MGTEDADATQQALDLAEADLRERERQALEGDPTPQELRALAEEYDKLATDRDRLADAYDDAARVRDAAGFTRDVRASGRDRTARARDEDRDIGALDRFEAGSGRDLAAGDRTDSLDDRQRAARARRAAGDDRRRAAEERDAADSRTERMRHEIAGLREALDTRLQIGQAEGLLMARYHLEPDAAFRLLVRLSQEGHMKLRDIAARLVEDAVEEAKSTTAG